MKILIVDDEQAMRKGIEIFLQNQGIEVEVEPRPDDVGYSRFRFIIEFDSPTNPNITYCYCLEDTGEWDLLFTN